jgi:predicted DNA-binding ribbon-helix-helix protein
METTRIHKRSVMLAGHKTSVSLEDPFWDALNKIAASEGVTTTTLVARIYTNRTGHNLSSAIRVFVLDHFQKRAELGAETILAYPASPLAPVSASEVRQPHEP